METQSEFLIVYHVVNEIYLNPYNYNNFTMYYSQVYVFKECFWKISFHVFIIKSKILVFLMQFFYSIYVL